MGRIDSTWFYEKLAANGSSLRDLARYLMLDPSAVSRMLNGDRKMSADEQDGIATFFGLSVEEVAMRRRGEAPGFSEEKPASYRPEPFKGNAATKMFTESDIVFKDGKRWMEMEDGNLLEVHPAFGCMKGTMTIPEDLDLTAPVDPDWGKVYEDD
jgi:transcriptional regulator with XRE-family HTH domain